MRSRQLNFSDMTYRVKINDAFVNLNFNHKKSLPVILKGFGGK